MVRLGGLLTFFGLGSVVLYSFGWQFRILMWADPMQPWLGVALAVAGVAVLAVKFLVNKDEPVPAGAPGGERFGPPPQGFAPPPGVQRGQGFPSQQGFPPGQRPAPGGGFAPAGQQAGVQPGGPHIGAQPGPGGPRSGPGGAPFAQPQGPEPVLGRPQFAPQVTAAPPGQQRPAPPAGLPQFPPRQPPPREPAPQQPFGPQG